MSNYPIQTIEKNNVIVKLCTENLTKFRNNIMRSVMDFSDKVIYLFEDWFDDEAGDYLVNSKGVAKCTEDDEFDSEIGKEIAFRKVKLAANIKKVRKLYSVLHLMDKLHSEITCKAAKILGYIHKDIDAIKEYNPEYNPKIFE